MKAGELTDLFTVAVVKLWHTADGLYMWVCPISTRFAQALFSLPFTSSWEFVTTLDYEWSVFRGRRQFLWTIWVCSRETFGLGFVGRTRSL